MKTLFFYSVIAITLLIVFENEILAQDVALPTENGEMNISIFLSFGEEYWKFTEKDEIDNVEEIQQDKTVFGINWVHNFGFGLYHTRIGYESWGNTIINPDSTSPEIKTDWRSYQDWSFVFGAGYMYLITTPVSSNPDSSVAFFGGGLDLLISSANTDIVKSNTKIDEITHTQYIFSIIVTGGINLSEFGITISGLFGANILLDWEEKKEKWDSGVLDKVEYKSKDYDFEVPIWTLALTIYYQLPTEPKFRFGIIAQFLNSQYISFQIGYTFSSLKS